MDYRTIVYRVADHVGHLTLNRPEAINALNAVMIAELEDLLNRLMGDDVRVLIISGAGGRGFCAGRASEYLLTGAPMDADTAMALGLASRLVPEDQLAGTSCAIAAEMASKNPLGLRLTKEAINQNLGAVSLEQALHLENRNQAFLIAGLKLAAAKS